MYRRFNWERTIETGEEKGGVSRGAFRPCVDERDGGREGLGRKSLRPQYSCQWSIKPKWFIERIPYCTRRSCVGTLIGMAALSLWLEQSWKQWLNSEMNPEGSSCGHQQIIFSVAGNINSKF